MYVKNTIGRRRASGWAERRRYYRRLIEQARLAQKDEDIRNRAPHLEKP